MYRNRHLAVIGGGDSACEEALYLTRFADRVTMIHRRDRLRASNIMAQRVLDHEGIDILWNSSVSAYITNESQQLTGLEINGSTRLEVAGAFLAIGHQPNTAFLQGLGTDLDSQGYISITEGAKTTIPGLFAAGDVRDPLYRQAITAAGMGAMAALEAEHYLANTAM